MVTMDLAQQLLAAKKDFLVPCVYHFYQRPPVLVRGEGAYLFDAEGRRYLDCYSGVTVMNAGHSNPEILEAAIDQLRRLQHTTTIYLTEPMLELARAIAELAPGDLRRSFFCASGSEANEGALAAGHPGHRTAGMRLSQRRPARADEMGDERDRAGHVADRPEPAGDGPRRPRAAPSRKPAGTGTTAAAGHDRGRDRRADPGQRRHHRSAGRLLAGAAAAVHRYGTLLIADEIQTAWNRTGRWFATEHWNVVPDIVTVAKALGNGFPIAAYITTDEIAAHYTRPGAATFGGNLVSCRAALATLAFHQRHQPGRTQHRPGRPSARPTGRVAAAPA